MLLHKHSAPIRQETRDEKLSGRGVRAGGSDVESDSEGGPAAMEAAGPAPGGPPTSVAGSAPGSAPASGWLDDDGTATEADGLMVRSRITSGTRLASSHCLRHTL